MCAYTRKHAHAHVCDLELWMVMALYLFNCQHSGNTETIKRILFYFTLCQNVYSIELMRLLMFYENNCFFDWFLAFKTGNDDVERSFICIFFFFIIIFHLQLVRANGKMITQWHMHSWHIPCVCEWVSEWAIFECMQSNVCVKTRWYE